MYTNQGLTQGQKREAGKEESDKCMGEMAGNPDSSKMIDERSGQMEVFLEKEIKYSSVFKKQIPCKHLGASLVGEVAIWSPEVKKNLQGIKKGY
jgi:hypothetical protein